MSMAQITYREAVARALREPWRMSASSSWERTWEATGRFRRDQGFLEEYGPERIRETPIAESVISGAGAGAAMAGLRPIVELMTINFSLLAMGPDHQPRRQGALHVRRADHMPIDRPHRHGRRRFGGRYPLAEF